MCQGAGKAGNTVIGGIVARSARIRRQVLRFKLNRRGPAASKTRGHRRKQLHHTTADKRPEKPVAKELVAEKLALASLPTRVSTGCQVVYASELAIRLGIEFFHDGLAHERAPVSRAGMDVGIVKRAQPAGENGLADALNGDAGNPGCLGQCNQVVKVPGNVGRKACILAGDDATEQRAAGSQVHTPVIPVRVENTADAS